MNAMHISLPVRQLDRTLSFYRELFGQEPAKVRPDYAKFELNDPPLVISFLEQQDTPMSEGHFGIRVDDAETLDRYRQRIQAADIATREEEQVSCCYALQDKFWVEDPDGHAWEVYQFLEDREVLHERDSNCCVPDASSTASCC